VRHVLLAISLSLTLGDSALAAEPAATAAATAAEPAASSETRPPGWVPGISWTVSFKDAGREVSRRSYQVTRVEDHVLFAITWPGGLDARPPKPNRVRLFVLDDRSRMFGVDRYGSGATFSPFEPWGCLPLAPGRDCLAEPFRFDVTGHPSWLNGRVQRARFADAAETFVLEGSGERLEVIRFVLRVQRNNGWYTREMLYSPRLPYPLHSVSSLDGAREVSSTIVEYRMP